eukprot:jgi/Bigna1/84015/fgenesh1_pg.120_\
MAENMHAASVGVDGRRGDGSSSSKPPLRRSTSQGYAWEFPGEGEVVRLNFKDKQRQQPRSDICRACCSLEEKHAEPLLGELPATAICGNDITSSCLYVCGLCAADAGVYAPLAVCLVIATLYLFRNIYVEVCSALPMNGGTFSVLLHTTTKKIAAAAACMSILSYVATEERDDDGTAVFFDISVFLRSRVGVGGCQLPVHDLGRLSGRDCNGSSSRVLCGFEPHRNHGVRSLFEEINNVMTIMPNHESGAAMVIFAVHIATIATLALFAAVYILTHGASPIVESYWSSAQPSFFPAIFYGFGGAMLGVSGFETSAQFIEEQAPGVFAKTLRNMWIAVALINPLLTLEALCIVPVEDIQSKYHLTLLAKIADVSGGAMLRYLVHGALTICCVYSCDWYLSVGLDAFLVLSGAVLTSYVGVVGVTRRLALDSCVPEFLLAQNKWRGTNHWIIIGFFLVCCSMLSILQGDTAVLSKLPWSVRALHECDKRECIGNLMLKTKRGKLRRDLHAPVWSVMLGMILVSIGLLSTVVKEPSVIRVFGMYYTCSLLITAVMFSRKQVIVVAEAPPTPHDAAFTYPYALRGVV